MPLLLSLCCISEKLKARGVAFQTMTVKSFLSKRRYDALRLIGDRIAHNLSVCLATIKHCEATGIDGYRFSSSMFPLIDHEAVLQDSEAILARPDITAGLEAIKTHIASSPLRFSSHPSPYVTLTSDIESAVANSISDLNRHGWFFDQVGLPRTVSCPINIHIRKDGEPTKLRDTFLSNAERLSDSALSRLVLENNDNARGTWHTQALVKHFGHIFPITFDTLHHSLLSGDFSATDAFLMAKETWRNTQPIFHYSEGIAGGRNHADYATSLPFRSDCLWDVELKMKDYAIDAMRAMV